MLVIWQSKSNLPNPSYVDVPRPNSSMITNELAVAPLKIDAVSSISCIKVETPRSCKKIQRYNQNTK